MNDNVAHVLNYIMAAYPKKEALSSARVVNMLYLCDWKNVLERDRQLTGTKWQLNDGSPYVPELHDLSIQDGTFKIGAESTLGRWKRDAVDLLRRVQGRETLAPEAKDVINFVMKSSEEKSNGEFNRLVASTYPVITGGRGGELDLVCSAHAYKEWVEAEEARGHGAYYRRYTRQGGVLRRPVKAGAARACITGLMGLESPHENPCRNI